MFYVMVVFMGRRGPPPKPSAIRERDGTKVPPGVAVNEPRYVPQAPKVPAGMTPGAKKIWKTLVYTLEASGVLREIDWLAFRCLCEDEAFLQDLRAGLAIALKQLKERAVANNVTLLGNAAAHFAKTTEGRRLLGSIREIATSCITQRREFGLTPASNTRVEANGTGGVAGVADEIEEALCGTPADFYQPDLVQ